VPWIPALSALASFALMAGLSSATWRRLIIWMVIGLVIYAAYSYRHSFARRRLLTEARQADA
jgi:APA family basic amino acid/polyamine antiporter